MSGRILIVDDEPAITMSLEFLLGSQGYATKVACDGEEALRSARAFKPHLVILDLMLPGLSGLEVCRALRADGRFRLTKVLMLTARGAAADMERAEAAGVDAYQVKPFSTQDLLAQVRGLLAESDVSHAG